MIFEHGGIGIEGPLITRFGDGFAGEVTNADHVSVTLLTPLVIVHAAQHPKVTCSLARYAVRCRRPALGARQVAVYCRVAGCDVAKLSESDRVLRTQRCRPFDARWAVAASRSTAITGSEPKARGKA